jgi:O-antigen ligase
MTKFFGEMLFYMVRVIIFDLVSQAAFNFCVWVDRKIPGRWPKIVVGGLLGLAAFLIIPVVMGLLGL